MIQCYKTDVHGVTSAIKTPVAGCWIHAVAPDATEVAWLKTEIGITAEFVSAALDEEEISRIDYDDEVNQKLVIVDYPIAEHPEDSNDPTLLQYTTLPISVIFLPEKDMIVTISLRECPMVSEMLSGRVRQFNTHMRTRFLLQMLSRIFQNYLVCLRRIDKISIKTEQRLYGSMRNEELLQMLSLEKSLVFFSTSIKSAEITLGKIRQGNFIRLYEDDQNLMDDVLIEVHQAQEMCSIYSNILSGTMDAYASVISNNLNIVMKVLTVITIVMAIPNIIFGFYGMNVDLPFDGMPLFDTWGFPTLVAVVACVAAALVFKRKGLWK